MMKFYASRTLYGAHIELRIIADHPAFQEAAQPLVMKRIEDGAYVDPTVRIGRDEAQFLIDQLWDAGLRPSEGSGSAGAMLATQKHLKDMRTIVAKKLGVEFKDC